MCACRCFLLTKRHTPWIASNSSSKPYRNVRRERTTHAEARARFRREVRGGDTTVTRRNKQTRDIRRPRCPGERVVPSRRIPWARVESISVVRSRRLRNTPRDGHNATQCRACNNNGDVRRWWWWWWYTTVCVRAPKCRTRRVWTINNTFIIYAFPLCGRTGKIVYVVTDARYRTPFSRFGPFEHNKRTSARTLLCSYDCACVRAGKCRALHRSVYVTRGNIITRALRTNVNRTRTRTTRFHLLLLLLPSWSSAKHWFLERTVGGRLAHKNA